MMFWKIDVLLLSGTWKWWLSRCILPRACLGLVGLFLIQKGAGKGQVCSWLCVPSRVQGACVCSAVGWRWWCRSLAIAHCVLGCSPALLCLLMQVLLCQPWFLECWAIYCLELCRMAWEMCQAGKSFESFEGKVKYLMQASIIIRGTCKLAADTRCKGGDIGIIRMGKIWMGFFLQL